MLYDGALIEVIFSKLDIIKQKGKHILKKCFEEVR